MQVTVAHVGARPNSKEPLESLVQLYMGRCSAFARCTTECFRTEASLLEWLARQQGRTPALAIMLDSRGREMTSEQFAGWLGTCRDDGTQHIVFAVGPADGWSQDACRQARWMLSLGKMTMAHALARLVLAEQIYRAFTILTGHPYHGGH